MPLPLLLPLNRCSDPHCEILCFPHAGGSASYFQRWTSHLPRGFSLRALQLPLRENRLDAEPLTRMRELISLLLKEINALPDVPRVLFGHSMGAIVAWELALSLEQQSRTPQHLFISGQQPPTFRRPTHFHQAADEVLIQEVARFAATPSSVFDFPDLRELVLAQLRHDYALIERWQPTTASRIAAPITVFHGREDTEVTLQQAQRWEDFTDNRFRWYSWPGAHFYLTTHWQALLERLCQSASSPSLDMP
ncbi:thioesterase II family protein [Pantoea rodasii]|uniref:thioesterase II family protein n=1 Tax=Pantoea rodasii TaxID=1076549 RepID=UPI000907B7C3|nr:alpha/beta fold hydrolase [Pantoea rodasii]